MENILNTLNDSVFKSSSVEETEKIGRKIASYLSPGDIIGLIGPFGAGKTCLIKAICEYFKISKKRVTSPSYTLVNEYKGDERVIHFDVYRLQDEGEFELLDLDYYIEQDGVILIEWADKFIDLFPESASFIEIRIEGETERDIIWKKKR